MVWLETNTEKIHRFEIPTPFDVGDVNVFLIVGERLTLIDCGPKTEEARDVLTQKLQELGFNFTDIDTVVLTHHHPDHAGLLDYLPEDIEVIGHWKNNPWISDDKEFFKVHKQFFSDYLSTSGITHIPFELFYNRLKAPLRYMCNRSLTSTIKEKDSILGLPGWKVIETPGHAQSHIVLYHEQTEVMLGGDHILAHISSNPIMESPYPGEQGRSKPLVQYRESLLKCNEFPISRVLSGHGADVLNVSELITERLQKQEQRSYQVLKWLKERPMTAFEICKKLFPIAYQKQLGLTMSETIGQLDFLEYKSQVIIDKSVGQWLYKSIK